MTTDTLENRCFDEINIGDTASIRRTLSVRDVQLFATVSGDVNPTHLDLELVKQLGANELSAHGMWLGAQISGLLGNELPGPGTVYAGQDLDFHAPLAIGEEVTISITASEKFPDTRRVTFACLGVNGRGEKIVSGVARVIAPDTRITMDRPDAAQVSIQSHDHFDSFVERCAKLPPVAVAVVHPCDESSLGAALEAARESLIEPILVGPLERLRAVAEQFGFDLSGVRVEDVAHSHAAAFRAVELVRLGEAAALMKGSLHTDELMAEVVSRQTGLRTERRITHAFLMDVPTYHKPLIVSDAAINIAPDLDCKRDICQNAIDLAHVLGLEQPKVAIICAVEGINSRMVCTTDAASLCKMADRGQITGAILDGPLALDNAISKEAARIKKIDSLVAGDPDILIVPDLAAGNILAKQLTFMSHADGAGIVLGARVPIILTSRADNRRAKLASCAVACLMASAALTHDAIKAGG
ncbi:MAG: Phosphate acetyltransferase [Candidatus Accumulibacter appositus]|uniref:Phosphate acetyltransferase n=1 Tax=Candidatus Accumulibacter appositus TaxID=1454003 RepID=A0A011PZI3_9PROT|nr:bifunctional enoyl-CoA hydratase/phosphate acetyltransferase [Accumulibacter sp.]EXI82367.1 MAG: Phosphate acetyltransferase [Candidatus Accumulibacter appositus]HRF03470.1 bifunctional enoyl-CoA hydratase/phosphate acetyltransferase [Accumulibacter sp.]